VRAERIVVIDDARFEGRPGEEPAFGRPVLRHRAVIVEMVARQVREQRDVERDAVHAP
jgi:hypothetical protein